MKKEMLAIMALGLLLIPEISSAESRSWHHQSKHHDYSHYKIPPGQARKYWPTGGHYPVAPQRPGYSNHSEWRPGPFWGNPGWFGERPTQYRQPAFNSGDGAAWDSRELWHGVQSGQLSAREVRDLKDRQAELQREYARYRADGYLSSAERRDLERDHDAYRRSLNHELNDGEHRY
ncbi:MAG: hypothetical protein K1X83_08025 [Oligoflexia bacterium]|nr:hypothetical protein [Oligoflexia bacterium]